MLNITMDYVSLLVQDQSLQRFVISHAPRKFLQTHVLAAPAAMNAILQNRDQSC